MVLSVYNVDAEGWGEGEGAPLTSRSSLAVSSLLSDLLVCSEQMSEVGSISFKSNQSCCDLVFSWEILPTVTNPSRGAQ